MESFRFRTATVENARRRYVLATAPVPKLLDGEPEARVIAMRLGLPPPCYGNWSSHLPERQVVELGTVDSISRETMGRTLSKGTISLTVAGISGTIDDRMLYMK